MLIKLDYRETDLQVACVQLLSKHFKSELTIKNENLPLGDMDNLITISPLSKAL